MNNLLIGILIVSSVVVILSVIMMVAGVATSVIIPPGDNKRISHYPSVAEIEAMNKEYAAKRARHEINVERGKVLKFDSKPWYKSNYSRGNKR